MVLSLSQTALNTTYLGNKQINESIPIVPGNETIPSNDTSNGTIPIPTPDPTPTPTPTPVDPTTNPTSTYKLDNMQLGLVIGGGIVGFGVLVALVIWSISVCCKRDTYSQSFSQADAENLVYQSDRNTLMREARAQALM